MKSEKFTLTNRINLGSFIKVSVLSAFMMFWYSSIQAQSSCPLSCNNLVQVSLDDQCVTEITPGMILEAMGTGCDYRVVVLGTNGHPLPPPPGKTGNNWVTAANIGQTLTTEVWLGNNRCWGSILIEDKLPPVIDCPGDITVKCWDPNYQAGVALPLPTATDNCTSAEVKLLSDVLTVESDCDPSTRAVRVLRYQAKDASGNVSPICERTITYEKITIADISFPKNYDGTPKNRPHLECDGSWAWNPNKSNVNAPFPTSNWDKNGNGYPDPAETGAPFVRDDANIIGYINGRRVTTPASAGCIPGTLIFPGKESLFSGCSTEAFKVDTIYNTSIFSQDNICKINTTFEDSVLPLCGENFKVIRKWKVVDWCSGEIAYGSQLIAVMDSKPPVISCPADLTSSLAPDVLVAGIITADPYTCTGTWKVRPPVSIFDCSETTWTVDFMLADPITGGEPGPEVPWVSEIDGTKVVGSYPNYTIQGLPLGRTWVRYIVTDECGNSTECFTEIDVFDKTPPVPVCDEHTVVTLTNNGWAHAYAYTFDDGSHDNCSDVSFSVRRTTPGCDSNGSSSEELNPFRDFVQFCCEDVGQEVMVELRVTDAAGNSNTCMVLVTTHDKVPPIITCPTDVTIGCGADTSAVALGIPIYSEIALDVPYYTDNCPNPTMSWKNSGTIDNCGQGVITRTFTVTDNGGRKATCTQRITVRNTTPYTGPTKWPETKEINGCLSADTHPDQTGKPTLGADACSQVAYTYEDQLFNFVEDVCYKILRKWTVIDWCKFAPNRDPNGGLYPSATVEGVNTWTYTQTIKVLDTEKPVINTTSKGPTDAYGENCDGFVDLTNSASDCTPSSQLKWNYTIDLNNDGVGSNIVGHTNDASGVYPIGTHRITWVVEDHCGNLSTVTYTFEVRDRKKPTPYCISQLTTVVMPTSGNIDIWANDFDLGSSDNCEAPGCGLKFTFNGFKPPVTTREVLFNSSGTVVGNWPTNNQSLLSGYASGLYQRWLPAMCSSAKLYTCDKVGINTENMSVWDAAGNTDYCTVTLNVQANGDACTGSRIAGNISTETAQMVPEVSVLLYDVSSNESRAQMTNNDGHFTFVGMSENTPYRVAPELDTDPLKGVNTLDLVYIQRHILNIQKLTSPYKYLAADINNDERISVADLSELRKLILGIYTEFPNNTSWRFLDKSVNITNPEHVWDVNENIYIDNFNTDMMNNNFVAIKVGDVDNSIVIDLDGNSVQTRSVSTLNLVTDNQDFKAGEIVEMVVTSNNFNSIIGTQGTLNFDSETLEFVRMIPGAMQMDNSNYSVRNIDRGMIPFSWNEYAGQTIDKDAVLFTVEFRAIANNTLANAVKLSSDITRAEAYTHNLSEVNIELTFRSQSESGAFELSQNNPNPFTSNTVIGFNLPQAGQATLTVYNVTGQVLKTISGQYPKGRSEISLSASDFDAHGVMFYELESNGQRSTKKMIYLNK